VNESGSRKVGMGKDRAAFSASASSAVLARLCQLSDVTLNRRVGKPVQQQLLWTHLCLLPGALVTHTAVQ